MVMKRLLVVAGGILAAVVLLPLGAFAADRVLHEGRVLHNVTVASIELSGLTEAEALAATRSYEAILLEPIVVHVDGHPVDLAPEVAGVDIDEEAIVAEALRLGRTGRHIEQFFDWVGAWFTPRVIAAPVTYDAAAIEWVLDRWDTGVVARPPFHGAVEIEGGAAVARLPEEGAVIERSAATALLAGLLQAPNRQLIRLPLRSVPTFLTADEVAAAAAEAAALIDADVVLHEPVTSQRVVVERRDLVAALRTRITVQSLAVLEVSLDEDVLRAAVAASVDRFRTPPVDARFKFDEETSAFAIVPSVDGMTIDLDAVPAAIVESARTDRVGFVPRTVDVAARFSTADLEAMDMRPVSTFTTTYSCCQSRVTNIHLIADAVDGAVVLPGATFSVNDHVGRRRTADGYRRAGAIIRGEVTCCDHPANVGGGTSQFATTFYNAVFYGCYEDVFHQPHSIYFSRYPRGREATLGFPLPDVVLRNDTETMLWIDTSHTATSVTVTFYGDTGGRVCTDEVEGRNPITVTRVIRHDDGTVEREAFTWTYRYSAA